MRRFGRREPCDPQDGDIMLPTPVVVQGEDYQVVTDLAAVAKAVGKSSALNGAAVPSSFDNVNVKNSSVHFGNKTYIDNVVVRQIVDPAASKQRTSGVEIFLDKYGVTNSQVACGIALCSMVCVVTVIMVAVLTSAYAGHKQERRQQDNDEDLRVNVPIKTDIDGVLLTPSSLRLISRREWLAQPPSGPIERLSTPVSCVVITHTATENCTDQASCVFDVRYMQTFHMESRSWYDIGYNFLVGGDGAAYEGRGWDSVGAHTKGYNAHCMGIALIGTFNDYLPPQRQLVAAQLLIRTGITLGKIADDYKLFGHRQLIPSLSPGKELFAEIQKWAHFARDFQQTNDSVSLSETKRKWLND